VRLLTKDADHTLHELLQSSVRVGLRFCPLKYLSIMSRELERSINDSIIVSSDGFLVHDSTIFDSITVCEVCSDVEVRNRIKIYTDGSVYNGPVGYGACAAVLISRIS